MIAGPWLRSSAFKENQASPALLQGATPGRRPNRAYPASRWALGEQGLLLIFQPRRPTRARLSCNSMLRPQTLPMTRRFAPGRVTADRAAAAMAGGWPRAPDAQRSPDLARDRRKG